MLLGQDANWDLRNYHLYNPYAFLNGRAALDLLPAGQQSTFNPLIDVPYYVLAMGPLSHAPRILAAVAGLPFGALLLAILRLARWMLGKATGFDRLLPWIAAGVAGTAAGTASEIGTTFNDIPIAALLLGAFVVGKGGPGGRRPYAALVLAGGMIGSAVALKPTALVIAPGIVAGLLLAGGGRVWPCQLAALALGGVPMLAALAGPWALTLMRLYASPVFPLENAVFRSDWYPPVNILDQRFLPRTIGQALFYPFYWIQRNRGLVTEPSFRDARLALAMLALPVLGVAWVRQRLAQPRRVAAVLLATVVAYGLWLCCFSILRYAVALEALASLLIVAAVQVGVRWLTPRRHGLTAAVAAAMLGASVWHTELPVWWRVPYGARVFDFERIQLPPNSLVLAINAPVAMAIPFIDSPGYTAIGITGDTLKSQGFRLFTTMTERIKAHAGPFFALTDDTARAVEAAPWFGLRTNVATCRPLRNNISYNASIILCQLYR